MYRKIINIFLLLLFSLSVVAETLELPGCSGNATVGVNALDTSRVFSPDCVGVSDRVLICDCNNSIQIYSGDPEMVYDFHIDYYDGDVKKNKEFYDINLVETYVDLTNLEYIVYFIVGLFIVPILIIVGFLYVSKKLVGDKK